jgi:PPOX class probable FMN-dependent enzyme
LTGRPTIVSEAATGETDMDDIPTDDPSQLADERALRTVYAQPSKPVVEKSFAALDKHSQRFIELSPFFCIGSSRPDGLGDVSPRGGEPGFTHVLDDRRIAFPDRPGNNRLDTLTNIMHRSAVGLLFFVPGVDEMLRVNGVASVTLQDDLVSRFVHDGKPPRSVVVVETHEVYFHCSKALRRSDLWNPDKRLPKGSFPTLGQIVRDQFKLLIPARVIDFAIGRDAKKNLY